MGILDRISGILGNVERTAASLLKVALMSRTPSGRGWRRDRPLTVLGNGPSLRETIDQDPQWLRDSDRMAVNFAANAPQFRHLRPEWYVLADPHFFNGGSTDPNVASLWRNLADIHWAMTLYVPVTRSEFARQQLAANSNISIKTFNLTPAEGFPQVTHALFKDGLAMPRPRNVLIPAIMLGMREGYTTIYLAGADHSWSRTLWVDDKNRVISVQPHFYQDNEKELDRVAQEYAGYHLHDIFRSLTIAFRSYHEIAAYARETGVKIINATPGSFIDAFPRLK